MKSSMNRKREEEKTLCAPIETQLKFNVRMEYKKSPTRKINISEFYVGFHSNATLIFSKANRFAVIKFSRGTTTRFYWLHFVQSF